MEEMIKKLEDIFSNFEYGSSDLDSAKISLPDYEFINFVKSLVRY